MSEYAESAESSAAHEHADGTDCQWCPLCRLAAVLRGEDPETVAKVLAGANAVIDGLRMLLARLASPAAEDRDAERHGDPDAGNRAAGADPGAGNDGAAGSTSRVHRIDLDS